MNRPTILNYEFVKDKFESKFNYELYTQELEKYCDELEKNKDKQFNSGFNEATKICSEKIIALEKALDKACEFIDDIHSCPYDAFDFELEGGCDSVCSERTENSSLCWKEWCLK